MAFKCPLGDKCPEHELFHFAANKIQIESAEYIMKIKELKKRLKVAQKEISVIIDELRKLAQESEEKED